MAPRRRASERLNLTAPAVLTRSELREISREVAGLESRNAELETRAVALTASLDQVIEPPVYGPGSGHSYFADIRRFTRRYGEGDGGTEAAERRLRNHQAWQHHENERRLAIKTAQAEHAAERALSQTGAEARLLQRWQAAGGQLFDRRHELEGIESRGMTRNPGQGGYFVPPGWLVDQFVHAPRAGAPFAALWASLPLPPKVSSVNLPRFAVGARAGVQPGDAAPLGTADPADGYIGAPVLTLAAQVDVSMQWLDQCPVPPDETIGADLAEAFMTNLDGQLLLGSGTNGQLPGIIPGGQFSAASMVWLSSTNNTAAQGWANGQGATAGIAQSLHQMSAQLKRKVARYRALPPTHWVAPSSLWDMICGSAADAQNRPLVTPGMHSPSAVPVLHGLPVIGDENIPETFGGAIPPVMSAVSRGLYAPLDGNGTWIPIVLGRWKDCLYFQSEPVIRIMDEALSGTGQVRFQAYSYVAAVPGRVAWAGASGTFSGTSQAGGLNNGAPVSYGALTNFTANSPLQPAANGY
jgi:HK97 family phage major capsid protein